MKIISLAEKLLKFMVTEYKYTGDTIFGIEIFKETFPEYDEKVLSQAIFLLKKDGFVAVLNADNIACHTVIDIKGIRNCEENTWLKKGYTIAKEIKSWL